MTWNIVFLIAGVILTIAVEALVVYLVLIRDKRKLDNETPTTQEPATGTEDSEQPKEPEHETETMNGDPAVTTPKEPESNEPTGESETNGDATSEANSDGDSEFDKLFSELIEYFGSVVPFPRRQENGVIDMDSQTVKYLRRIYDTIPENDELVDSIPMVFDYSGDGVNPYALDQLSAWLLGMVLAELVPAKVERIEQLAYDFRIKGVVQPVYGFTNYSDPNKMRDVAAMIYASMREPDTIPELRRELVTKMVSYKNDISELYPDLTQFMPPAPPPYLDAYKNRKRPYIHVSTEETDEHINFMVAQCLNLDSNIYSNVSDFRQETIQAIANKEYKKPHLFGKPRTVTDPTYGTMTFNPVFGVHNIGVAIDPDSKLADLAYTIGKMCSNARKPLLDAEYGRRRPGQGYYDPSANQAKRQRALVNYAIEEGDGHTTGYYNQGGDYVDGNGNHIGDYETYYQGQLYANSYPSGHSAFIQGAGMVLAMAMPERRSKILEALVEFSNARIICRYHNQSDVIHGRVCGATTIPLLLGCTNIDFDAKLKEAVSEQFIIPF